MASIIERKEVSQCLDSLLIRLKITRESMKIDSDFGKGANYTGDIIKLWVNGRDEKNQQVELRLLLKVALRDISTRKMISIERAYQCETFMYETVFDLFAQMQAEAKIEDRFESYPKYYASSTKPMEELVVLENLTSFQVVDRLETLTFRQARMLAKEIGKLHALSFVLRRKNPQRFQQFSKNIRNETFEEDEYVKLVIYGLIAFNPKYLTVLESEKLRMVYEKVRSLPTRFHEMYDRYYRFDPDNEYGVIGHCDLWSTNLLFNEQEVRIIDWQTARICSPAVDLSLILFICCNGEVRNKHAQHLTEVYYDSCSAMLRQFDEDPNIVFPRTVLEAHLKMYSGYALCLALRTVSMMSVPENEIPDPTLAQNYDDMIKMYMEVNMVREIFDDRIRDMLTDYVNYGYDL
ncbi:hypothetical protein FQR65_LT15939 [Abscondita terminalis]|nr:hypothetical protein FQR65_LT15939 [Abscondita terminalis]